MRTRGSTCITAALGLSLLAQSCRFGYESNLENLADDNHAELAGSSGATGDSQVDNNAAAGSSENGAAGAAGDPSTQSSSGTGDAAGADSMADAGDTGAAGDASQSGTGATSSNAGEGGTSGTGASGNGGTSGTGGDSAGAGATGQSGNGGTSGTGGDSAGTGGDSAGTGATGQSGNGGTSGTGGGFGAVSCGDTSTAERIWSFDSDIEGWELSGQGTLGHNASVGNPDPGALQVDHGPGATRHVRYLESLGDLSGRVIVANVRVESGNGVDVRLFVQTGVNDVWANGALVTPTLGQWACLTLDIDNPDFTRAGYDPTDVVILGVEINASGTVQLFIDQVAY